MGFVAGDDTPLILFTALDQEPCLKYEEVGGGMMHRLKDSGRWVRSAPGGR
jgi:hypothetical protein